MRVRRLVNRGRQPLGQRMADDQRQRLLDYLIAPWQYARRADAELEALAAYSFDIYEDDQKIYVNAELPGFKAADIDVTVSDGILDISGSRVEEEQKGEKHLNERCQPKVHRRCCLFSPVDERSVKVNLVDGVLHLELFKARGGKATHIEIQ
jgi:HSP20 family molecular chaperone IbpA